MSPSTSTLSRLPAEIRSAIYEYVVTAEQVVTFTLDSFQREYYTPAIQPALTRVSRQVRAESLPLYYECNDFVLHTESPKSDDAFNWLRANAAYLSIMRRLTLWIRYMPFANRHSSRGAIAISIYRPRKRDSWKIDRNWNWITVVRRAPDLHSDVKYIIQALEHIIPDISKCDAGPDDYIAMISDLRLFYTQQKMS